MDKEQEPLDYETALTEDDQLDLKVWLRLFTCENLIESKVRNRLREDFGTTLPRFDLMSQLDRAPDGLTMGQLSRRLMVSNGNVTGVIDRFVSEGLVDRTPTPEDRRVLVVKLTPKGKKEFSHMVPEHSKWISDVMSGMSREELVKFYELLGVFKKSITREGE
ncbi:MAG: MarR family transcriptional regulator [Rhodospirillales bacterium]|nr:MarR family transcriptional regulator [Rhodospirillales bacterium]